MTCIELRAEQNFKKLKCSYSFFGCSTFQKYWERMVHVASCQDLYLETTYNFQRKYEKRLQKETVVEQSDKV